IEDAEGEEELLTDSLPAWLEELSPAAEDLGCAEELWSLLDIVKLGVGYQRQRTIFERTNSYEAVVAFLVAEMEAGEPLDPAHFVDKSLHKSGVKGWKVRAR
ncbi:MAG: carboxylate--amine ligase, partial [Varibaculum cambriense]|nr:carboxylate--amine ligase [Varibaculum cambriense]